MAVTLCYMSGSPYAWRAWLALAHKGVDFTLRRMSFDAGDFRSEEFLKLTPRKRVPVLIADDFALYESAAIVEYVEERWPQPSLFSADLHRRAIERRLIREVDQYFADCMERLVRAVLFTPEEKREPARIAAVCSDLKDDYALYPLSALIERMASRNPPLIRSDLPGSKIATWMRRMQALPTVQKTWPP